MPLSCVAFPKIQYAATPRLKWCPGVPGCGYDNLFACRFQWYIPKSSAATSILPTCAWASNATDMDNSTFAVDASALVLRVWRRAQLGWRVTG